MIKQQIFKHEAGYNWFDINDLTEADGEQLKQRFNFTADIISYISDRHERPHYDFDKLTNSHLVVYDVPIWPTPNIKHFTARPVTFLLLGDDLFTFHTDETGYVFDEFNDQITHNKFTDVKDVTEQLMIFLLYSSKYFQRAITQLNVERNELDRRLSDEIDNKDLVGLSNIEKSLVYLASSIQTNVMMLESLANSPINALLSSQARERLDDVLIESDQSAQMVQISRQVTNTLSATSNNMMNNNLNDTMKFLTVWSLVLTIPTIMTGFYGMNVRLPLVNREFDWIVIVLLTVVFMVWLIILMKRHNFF